MDERQQAELERRRMAEEAFYHAWWSGGTADDWATIASEMGITDFYRKLKDGK